MADERAIVLWKPREVPPAEQKRTELRTAEADARIAVAEARKKHAELRVVGVDLVLSQFRKWLALAQHPDFENSPGPIEPAIIMKIAEFVTKEFRLDSGQATEHIAHVIAPAVDFSKLSQEERDQWRALAVKVGSGEGT